MGEERDSQGRAGLKVGMVVRDESGRLKEVTRIEGDKVYWQYTEAPLNVSSPGEMCTDYAEFADRHFIIPFSVRQPGRAA